MKLAPIPKTRFCTISEIARTTGLGRATIHRALETDGHAVSMKTRQTVSLAVMLLNEKAIARYRAEMRAEEEPDMWEDSLPITHLL